MSSNKIRKNRGVRQLMILMKATPMNFRTYLRRRRSKRIHTFVQRETPKPKGPIHISFVRLFQYWVSVTIALVSAKPQRTQPTYRSLTKAGGTGPILCGRTLSVCVTAQGDHPSEQLVVRAVICRDRCFKRFLPTLTKAVCVY